VTLKLRPGAVALDRDAATDIQMVTAVRAALGDEAVIRLDANYGWSLSTAVQVIRSIEPLNIANIEDPVLGYQNMARLRRHTSIPSRPTR
jgi:glucarate dehydratase